MKCEVECDSFDQPLDSVIEYRVLPLDTDSKEQRSHHQAEIENAKSLIDSLVAPVADPYQSMTLKEAKLARLGIVYTAEEER